MYSYSSHTDEYLFSLLQNNDERAFVELYERYWRKLLIRANYLLDSHEDAEELIHDIFVTLWEKRDSIYILNSFRAYIFAMLQYGSLRILASRKRNRTKPMLDEMPEKADYSTQDWLDFDSLREELESAINQLPERCQLIFRMSREQGLSDKAIAEKLYISVNTVRTQMYRALQKLKAIVNFFFFL
jgi:RNA polymerase sigma-70 factor (ECF subfamily)